MTDGKISWSKKSLKYFIGYKDDEKLKQSCIMLLKMSWYIKCFDETKYMYFLKDDKNLLRAYNRVWDKISDIMQNSFDSEPVYI